MPFIDNVSSNTFIFNYQNTLTLSVTNCFSIDTLAYGKEISISANLRVQSYSAPMTVQFEQSDESSFTPYTVVPQIQTINPMGTFVVSSMTPAQVPLPAWGLIGTDRYIRVTFLGGIGNVVYLYYVITYGERPALNYANYS